MSSTKNNLVSVVIPAYNEERDIGVCLDSLNKQSYNNIEIIVVDDGSTDKTREIVKSFRKVKLVFGEHKGPGFSRNLGARITKGAVLVFVDSDMTFEKDYISNLVRPIFQGKTIGTAHGVEYATNMNNRWARCWGRIRVNPSETSEKEGVIFRAIRKDIFLEKGGFDPKYGYADDQTFFIKYMMKSVLVPDAVCYHRNAESLKEVYKQSRWIGASLLWKHKALKFPIFSALFLLLFGIMMIPLALFFSIKKLIFVRDFSLTFYYPLFYLARLTGSFFGFYNWLIRDVNVR